MPHDQRHAAPHNPPEVLTVEEISPVLSIDVEHHDRLSGPLLLITLSGDLDLSTVAALRQHASYALKAMTSAPRTTSADPAPDDAQRRHNAQLLGTVVVDLSATDFIDSAGLGGLVAVWRLATKAGCACHLAGAQSHAQRLFAMTGVDRVIPSHAHLSDALRQDVTG